MSAGTLVWNDGVGPVIGYVGLGACDRVRWGWVSVMGTWGWVPVIGYVGLGACDRVRGCL
jgi:hypothetical protein